MEKYYTKEEMEKIFLELGLKAGMIVCLQVNPSQVDSVIGGMQTIIEAMMQVIGKKGCLMVPCFSDETLDPSCTKKASYSNWSMIRENMIGYKAQLSESDAFAMQFLRNEEVQRSKHPTCSFAYWGSYRSAWLDCVQDFPISFDKQCAPLSSVQARNVLIGYPTSESVLLPAIAKEKKIGTIFVQRAKIRRAKTSIFKLFLQIRLNEKEKVECLEQCHEKSYKWSDQNIYSLWLDTSLVKKEAMHSKVSVLSLSK